MSGAPTVERTFPIPAGTPLTTCRSCGATLWFVPMPSGARMPVEDRAADCRAPTITRPGVGHSHFAHCPGAGVHRRRR